MSYLKSLKSSIDKAKGNITSIFIKKKFPYDYEFPEFVIRKWKFKYPQLSQSDLFIAQKALLQYFEMIFDKHKEIPMVSEIADQLWHEFIESSEYAQFCKDTFGYYLNHIPNNNEVIYDWRGKKIPLKMLVLYMYAKDSQLNIINQIPILFHIDHYVNLQGGYYFNIEEIEIQLKETKKSVGERIQKKKEERKSSSSGFNSTSSQINTYDSDDGGSSSCSGCGD